MKHMLFTLSALLLALPAARGAQEVGPALLDLALEPPAVNTRPGPEYDDAVRPGNMVIGIDRTPKGRLWAAWVGNGDSPNGFFLLATSDDNGKSWSRPRVVIDPTDPPNAPQRRALVGNVWTDPVGRLWLFFDQSLGYFDGRCGDWYTRCDNPDDAEPVWSKPVRFADGCTLDKPTVLSSGDWLLPVSLWTRDRISPDLFKDATWSVPQPSAIPNVSARFFIRRLESGKLLLVKNGPIDVRMPRRSSMTAFLSGDDGKTWGKGLLLDDRALVSYPDGFQAPDGTIHILYDWNRHTDAEILLAKFQEADIAAQTRATRTLVNKAYSPQLPKPIIPDPKWTAQAAEDAKQDFRSIPYDGVTPNKMVCDTTLRALPDGSWILFILAGGDVEPSPLNYVGVTRSADKGKTWTPLERFDVGFPREGKTKGQGPTELMVLGNRTTLFFSTHSRHWANDWRSWFLTSDDGFKTRSEPFEVPGRLKNRTFVRNHIVTRDGRILVPFQHYIGPDDEQDRDPLDRAFTNPRNGVIISGDGGKTWTEHGNIRLTPNDRYFGWAENNVVELRGGSIAMLIRADGLGGVLYRAGSRDGGRTWPEFASVTPIPNPGSKATLYSLGGDTVQREAATAHSTAMIKPRSFTGSEILEQVGRFLGGHDGQLSFGHQ